MSAAEFSARDLYWCARRERAMRESVFGRRVEAGKMRKEEAAREIAMMRAIEADYQVRMQAEERATMGGLLPL